MDTVPPPAGDKRAHWIRGAYMLLFLILLKVAELVAILVALLQFGFVLLSGEPNQLLLDFARGLSRYIYDVVSFLTYGSEDRPFPFKAWASGAGPR
jgi:hypothetical protein